MQIICIGGGGGEQGKREWEMSYINKAVMKMKTEQPHLTLQSHQPCSGFEYNMKDNWMKTIPTRSDNISRQSLMVLLAKVKFSFNKKRKF